MENTYKEKEPTFEYPESVVKKWKAERNGYRVQARIFSISFAIMFLICILLIMQNVKLNKKLNEPSRIELENEVDSLETALWKCVFDNKALSQENNRWRKRWSACRWELLN